jgi:hypothetical protein
MDKKKKLSPDQMEKLRGFEDLIQETSSPKDKIQGKGIVSNNKNNDTNFENYTFLMNDSERIHKLNDLFKEKLPFQSRFDQSDKIIEKQKNDIHELKEKIFSISDKSNSPYRKSLSEIFDSFFITK